MELKTVKTEHVPVRYYEGGKGQSLVFLHGAGGLDLDQGFLSALSEKFHVYAPLIPGYGDSEECAELRDMLDFTLHTWDVVAALGLEDPILVGFSMGGMIASEMAAVASRDVSRSLHRPVCGSTIIRSRIFFRCCLTSCRRTSSTTRRRERRSCRRARI